MNNQNSNTTTLPGDAPIVPTTTRMPKPVLDPCREVAGEAEEAPNEAPHSDKQR